MEKIVGVERDLGKVPAGEYYFRAGKWYVHSKSKTLLGQIRTAVGEAGQGVWLFVSGDAGILLDLERGRVEVFPYSKEEEEVLRVEYPDLEVAVLDGLSPSPVEVKKKRLSKALVLKTLFYGTGLAVGLWLLLGSGEEESVSLSPPAPVVSVPRKPPPPPCRENVSLFAENYVWGLEVVKERTQEGREEIYGVFRASSGGVVRVVLNPVPARERVEELVRLRGTRVLLDRTSGDVILEGRTYLSCLSLIEKNSANPLIVEELSEKGCRIRIEKGCFGRKEA